MNKPIQFTQINTTLLVVLIFLLLVTITVLWYGIELKSLEIEKELLNR